MAKIEIHLKQKQNAAGAIVHKMYIVVDDDTNEREIHEAIAAMPDELHQYKPTAEVVARSTFETMESKTRIMEHPPNLIALSVIGRPGYEKFTTNFLASQLCHSIKEKKENDNRRCTKCGVDVGKGRKGRQCVKCRNQNNR